MEEEKQDIKKAVETLRAGAVVLFASEYGWGFGCDATKSEAVDKLLAITQSSSTENIVVLIDNASKLQTYLDEVPDMAWDLIDLSAKAITIIYSSTRNLAQNILTKDAAVAIMVTTDHFAKAICAQFRNPIAFLTTTSASKTTATLLSEISNTAISSADYVVKTQQAKKNTAQLPALIKLKKGNLFEIIRK